jgi:hypothetical protein
MTTQAQRFDLGWGHIKYFLIFYKKSLTYLKNFVLFLINIKYFLSSICKGYLFYTQNCKRNKEEKFSWLDKNTI